MKEEHSFHRLTQPGQIKKPKILYLHWTNEKSGENSSALRNQLDQHFLLNCSTLHALETGALSIDDNDYVCCDLDYVDFDVLRAISLLRHNHPLIPVVLITIKHSEELAVWALRNRIWDYYLKPLGPRQLESLVENILGHHGSSACSITEVLAKPLPRGAACPRSLVQQKGPENNRALGLAINYIDENLGQRITIKNVANASGLSDFQLRSLFQRTLNITCQDYVLANRIARAKKLLLETDKAIADVGESVGFNDPSYFTRVFNRCSGVSPSHYRQYADAESGATLQNA
jgi:AraC-like DNA-binding protein